MRFINNVPQKDLRNERYIECASRKDTKEALTVLHLYGWNWASGQPPLAFDPFYNESDDRKAFLILSDVITYTFDSCDRRLVEKIEVLWDKGNDVINVKSTFCGCLNPNKKKSSTSFGNNPGAEFFICTICKREIL